MQAQDRKKLRRLLIVLLLGGALSYVGVPQQTAAWLAALGADYIEGDAAPVVPESAP